MQKRIKNEACKTGVSRVICLIVGHIKMKFCHMKIIYQVDEALPYLKMGCILAYPTEAVYGLGCDPFNEKAVNTLLKLKQRERGKGLILLISDWAQLELLKGTVPEDRLNAVRETWPGPITWIFPKSAMIPEWICGDHSSIAVRMSAHPMARALCKEGPIVSTSANIAGNPPAMDEASVHHAFPEGIDVVLSGPLGGNKQPSMIYDVLKGNRLR